MKTAIAIRHVGFEGLDGFDPALREAGYVVGYIESGDGTLSADSLDHADLLIVLGGPIGAYETDAYPVLRHEIAAIERRLKDQRPVMGVCLGAQLIALAAGARVFPSGGKEIGFAPIALTDAGRETCLKPFETEPVTLHWHGDTFDLPAGATLLATSPVCENQAFAMGPHVIGFQFHPEATGRDIEHWLIGHTIELAAAGIDPRTIRADAARYRAELTRKARATAAAWLAGLDR
ncbi:MAG: glutamine amidotransferase [Minwuiales bacterium]|nr:glutamine amidotransferase [Minwuiales bacterium]